jgi:hypothetical protein
VTRYPDDSRSINATGDVVQGGLSDSATSTEH